MPKTEWVIVPKPAARAAGRRSSGSPGAGSAACTAPKGAPMPMAARSAAVSLATATARALPADLMSSSARSTGSVRAEAATPWRA